MLCMQGLYHEHTCHITEVDVDPQPAQDPNAASQQQPDGLSASQQALPWASPELDPGQELDHAPHRQHLPDIIPQPSLTSAAQRPASLAADTRSSIVRVRDISQHDSSNLTPWQATDRLPPQSSEAAGLSEAVRLALGSHSLPMPFGAFAGEHTAAQGCTSELSGHMIHSAVVGQQMWRLCTAV